MDARNVYIDGRSCWGDDKIVDQIEDILGTTEFDVELFGVDYYADFLPDDFTIVDKYSGETLVICIDGHVITDRDEIIDYENDMLWC